MSLIDDIRDAVEAGAGPDDVAGLQIPDAVRALTTHKDETSMFDGLESADKDPRKSLHLDDVPLPELGPNECLVAIMASAINFNTVWTSIFEPLPTFLFLERYGRQGPLAKRHDLPYHIVGSDASGMVLRTGPGVTRWKPGDRVLVHCNYVDMEDPSGHDDSMMDTDQKIWGFETNFGGLADIALVKANQLMPKPAHLTWEESACMPLCNSTSYRMLVSHNAAGMKQGDVVLVWGAAGGLGGFAVQYVLNGGGIPVAVVSSADKADLLRELGCERVIDRKAEGLRFVGDDGQQDVREWRRLGKRIRELTAGEDPDIVFEHTGQQTFAASVFVTRRGGTVVTCASTSGYQHTYDNRYLWMNLKRIVGSHFANYREAWEANRLVSKGMIHPILSAVFPLEETGEAAYQVHHNLHEGKIGVLVLADGEGGGVTDRELRARHLDKITLFRRHA